MPTAEIDIEWIVREVIRRLRQVRTELPSEGESESATPTPGELKIEDRLVTLETLYKRLDGVQSIVVPVRAIVTPAVRDELKDRGIAIRHAGNGQGHSNGSVLRNDQRPTVWIMADGVDLPALQKMCGSAIAVKTANNIDTAINELSTNQRAVVITNTPSGAVVSANRNPHVRAAVGFNFPAVRQAIDEANANLLAIAPRGKGTTELFGLINEFLNRK